MRTNWCADLQDGARAWARRAREDSITRRAFIRNSRGLQCRARECLFTETDVLIISDAKTCGSIHMRRRMTGIHRRYTAAIPGLFGNREARCRGSVADVLGLLAEPGWRTVHRCWVMMHRAILHLGC